MGAALLSSIRQSRHALAGEGRWLEHQAAKRQRRALGGTGREPFRDYDDVRSLHSLVQGMGP